MELEITGYNNFFKMKGILSKRNLDVFKNEFKNVFDRLDTLTISIENIEWMDKYGVDAFAELHYEALSKNKKMAVIGLGCKELYEHFKSSDVTNTQSKSFTAA
ncbi:hypothetical protein L3X37_07965 [Sabulilitoribacter arenilitoris]|uniref:STAS domain-containing protein n=1 Tax=Wocania arenilitoris TaxID=2044858 RepID=A0AAE3JLK3_9FLAO|nr:hypothetical protein [Wocania arenilitoris]MCF7568297.1 hypothetical protein [Wocania arenilitoris]